MAEKEERTKTAFILDDDDVYSGGFNDFPEKPSEEPEKEPIKSVELDEEPKTEEPEKKQDDAPEAKPVEKEENKPVIDPAEQRWNETVAMISKKDEQIAVLVDQVKALTETVVKPKVEAETPHPPEKPSLTAADWEDDYEGCTNIVLDYREKLKEFNETTERERTQTEQQKESSNIQAIHQKDYAEECDELPALTDPKIKQVFANIYYDPASKLNTKPDGVFRAVKELKRQAKERGVDLTTFGKTKEPDKPAAPPTPDPIKIAEDEAARKARVSISAMHTGGKQSTDGKAAPLTAAQIDVARKFGLNPEAYAKTLAAMPGRK